jgi:hypothetical protein
MRRRTRSIRRSGRGGAARAIRLAGPANVVGLEGGSGGWPGAMRARRPGAEADGAAQRNRRGVPVRPWQPPSRTWPVPRSRRRRDTSAPAGGSVNPVQALRLAADPGALIRRRAISAGASRDGTRPSLDLSGFPDGPLVVVADASVGGEVSAESMIPSRSTPSRRARPGYDQPPTPSREPRPTFGWSPAEPGGAFRLRGPTGGRDDRALASGLAAGPPFKVPALGGRAVDLSGAADRRRPQRRDMRRAGPVRGGQRGSDRHGRQHAPPRLRPGRLGIGSC